MAYSKAKLKSRGNKELSWYPPFYKRHVHMLTYELFVALEKGNLLNQDHPLFL